MINLMSGLRDLLRVVVQPGVAATNVAPAPIVAKSRHRERTTPPPRPRVLSLAGSSSPTNRCSVDGRLEPTPRPIPIPSEPMLRLCLFGPLRAYVKGEVAIDDRFTRRKAKALLALLYLERGRYVPRDELLERLWPNADGLQAGAGRLKQTVLVLRRALEGERSRQTGWQYIVERDGSYFFNSRAPYACDLEELEHELRLAHSKRQQGHAEGALAHFDRAFALRRTDLLPEFRYEDWAAAHIAAEREAYLQALEEAARLHGERGDHARAVELLRRATREDQLRESSARQLMEWLWRNGEQAEAVRVYSRLRDALASRLQLEPDPKLTQLYQAIRGGRASSGEHGNGLSAAS
jgi:LuxR family transcriptional regulator, maltose regulon positive regulatory protein